MDYRRIGAAQLAWATLPWFWPTALLYLLWEAFWAWLGHCIESTEEALLWAT